MILIEERKSVNLPAKTSLFISFDYHPDIVRYIKSNFSPRTYDKVTKTWEVPFSNLSYFVQMCYTLTDIKIVLAEDSLECQDDTYYKSLQLDTTNYKLKPFDYQSDGIKYGLCHDKWLLLDAPGLGKTMISIHIADELRKTKGIKNCLIVCGDNSLKYNWAAEIKKHSDLDCKVLGERFTKKGTLKSNVVKNRIEDIKNGVNEFFIITNIETFRNKEFVSSINDFGVDMIVIDEIHKMKSESAKQTEGILDLGKINYKIGLTGTLITNSPLDMYTPLTFIEKLNLDSDYMFKQYFCVYGGKDDHDIVAYKNMDVLKDLLVDCSLRRTADLLDLPEFNIIEEVIDMDNLQQEFYNNVVSGVVDQVDKVEMNNMTVLSMGTRLRQATACPSILTTEKIPSAKVDRCVDLVNQIIESGNKVLVFSTFKETLVGLEERLSKYKPLVCTGDTKQSVVEDNKKLFQEDDGYKLMLATHQKMGVGHTLNAATYCIFLDTPWTAADFEQSWKRIHRIGSKKPVFIYNLITKNTIDERVLTIIKDKEALSDFITDDRITRRGMESLKKYIVDLGHTVL